MKRMLPFFLAAALLALSGCADKGGSGKDPTPEERTTHYKDAIEEARDTQTNTDFPLFVTGGETPDAIFELLGIPKDDISAYAMSIAAANTQAYAVAAVYPAKGKADAVMQSLKDYIKSKKQAFESDLPDQYEIARNAKIETLDDGTILLVMCKGLDEVFTSIKSSVNKQGK